MEAIYRLTKKFYSSLKIIKDDYFRHLGLRFRILSGSVAAETCQ